MDKLFKNVETKDIKKESDMSPSEVEHANRLTENIMKEALEKINEAIKMCDDGAEEAFSVKKSSAKNGQNTEDDLNKLEEVFTVNKSLDENYQYTKNALKQIKQADQDMKSCCSSLREAYEDLKKL